LHDIISVQSFDAVDWGLEGRQYDELGTLTQRTLENKNRHSTNVVMVV